MRTTSYMKSLERMRQRYEAALAGSREEREWFARFGSDGHHAVENAHRYEQLLRCGYPEEMACHINDSGWIDCGYRLFSRKEKVAYTADAECSILIAKLPNGKYVGGHELRWPSGGSLCGAGIFEDAFDTEREAKRAEIMDVIRIIEKGHEEGRKVLLPQLKKAAAECLQLSLF